MENSKVVKALGVVGGLTFVSRILGYVRDMVIASFFGAGVYADAFIAAFRIPNLMRRLIGEGSLSVAFVPVFSEYFVRGDVAGAHELARAAARLLTLMLAVLVILGIAFAPLIVWSMAPGFAAFPEKMRLTIDLTRIMFPYFFFVGLVALSMAVLNTLGHFAAPALAPVFLNLAMIGALLSAAFFSLPQESQVVVLAGGVVFGGAIQLAVQLPHLLRTGIRLQWRGAIFHPGLKKIGRLMLPTLIGSAVYQINILVGTLLASRLPQGSISYLYYADRLIQFPLGIFAVAMGTAVLPTLSRQAAGRDFAAVRQTFSEALCLIFFITLPAMVGLMTLRNPIVSLLFERGAFDAGSSQLTADALLYYCSGLWAFAAVRVLLPVFYALQETWVPVKSAIISMVVNIALGIVLMKPLGHCGIALATTLASILNFVLLTLAMHLRLGAMGWSRMLVSISKSLFCAILMGLLIWRMQTVGWSASFRDSAMLRMGYLAVTIVAGVGFFLLSAGILNMPEVKTILSILKKDNK